MKQIFNSSLYYLIIISSMLNSNIVFSVNSVHIRDIFVQIKRIVPRLTAKLYKGEMGRIGIIGGSSDYTGAPYYAGLASLKFGADLAFVFSSKSATIPIKSYSPELIVTSFYDEDDDDLTTPLAMAQIIIDYFPRLHSLVIGPGLGRHPKTFDSIAYILAKAKEDDYPTVIDADALFFVTNHLEYVYNFHSCIMTPNKVEFNRLVDSAIRSLVINTSDNNESSSSSNGTTSSKLPALPRDEKEVLLEALRAPEDTVRLQALSQYLGGVLILLKGQYDMITVGKDVVYVVEEEGSLRRCGGQGDILAGCLGVISHWVNRLKNNKNVMDDDRCNTCRVLRTDTVTTDTNTTKTATNNYTKVGDERTPTSFQDGQSKQPLIVTITSRDLTSEVVSPQQQGRDKLIIEDRIIGAVIASIVTKRASYYAYLRKKRAMTSPDVLEVLGEAFESLHIDRDFFY